MQKTGTAGAKATTGVGFEPQGLFFASFNRTSSSDSESHNRVSIGAASGEDAQAAIWVGDTDDINNDTHTDKATHTTRALALCDSDSPSTCDAAAGLDSFDSDGFTLDWVEVDSDARQFLFVAFGSALPEGEEETPTAAPVGGIAEFATLERKSGTDKSGPSAANLVVLAGAVTGTALFAVAGARYARRRWRA